MWGEIEVFIDEQHEDRKIAPGSAAQRQSSLGLPLRAMLP